jgi:chaperonin GroEL
MPLLKLISSLSPEERPFLLVCHDISHDALQLLIVNRLKGFTNLGVVRVPSAVSAHSQYLADIAVSTGATVLTKNTGNTYTEPAIGHLGTAERVIIEDLETVIVNGGSNPEDMGRHVNDLLAVRDGAKEPALKAFAESRLKTLEQKVVSIRVGGNSETDAEEKHYRYEDAVGAARATLRSGTVPGGGTVLYEAGVASSNPVLQVALKSLTAKVLENAGIDMGDEVVRAGFGFDVMSPEDGIVDLRERGVLDPAQSEVECVKTAISIAGLLITSGAIIVSEREQNEKAEF